MQVDTSQSGAATESRSPELSVSLTEVERDHLLRSVIASQALEGVVVSYEEAALLLDKILPEPLIDIG